MTSARYMKPAWQSILLLIPAIIHIILMAIFSIRSHSFLSRLDLIIIGGAIVYIPAVFFIVRRLKFGQNLILLIYSFLFVLLASEGLLRLYSPIPSLRCPWPPNFKRETQASDAIPGISGIIRISTNSIGLRGPAVNLDDVSLRILCVGGSTTECLLVSDKSSWPWLLQDMLAGQTGKSVFVGNAGRAGHLTLNHLYLLQNYKFAPKFEKVILLCGINDMGALLRHSYKNHAARVPSETFIGLFENVPYYKQTFLYYFFKKTFIRFLFPVRIVNQDLRGEDFIEARKDRQMWLKKNTIDRPPPGLEDALRTYKINLKSIIMLCREKKQDLLVLTQPTLYRKDLPENLQQLLWEQVENGAYSHEVLYDLINAYNGATMEVCKENNVDCLDLASMLPKDTTVFCDDCHFNISGCEKVAKILYNYYITQLEQR